MGCGLLLFGAAGAGRAASVEAPAPPPLGPAPIDWQLTAPGESEPAPLELALAPSATPELPAGAVYGPEPDRPDPPPASAGDDRYRTFGAQAASVKWEVLGIAGYMTALNGVKLARNGGRSFHFQDEGWFGKSTFNLGVDKFAHAFNTYVLADILGARIRHKTGVERGTALTGAVLGSGLMIYSEFFDGVKKSSGFSWQDVVANTAGAAFSVFRQTVPGVAEKIDFRELVLPNSNIYTFIGQRHYRQQRYLLALQLAGFDRLKDSPLRFVELHVGYYARGFTARERARGDQPERKPFVGIGLNLQELLFPAPRSRIGRAAREALDYVQVPYTYVHAD